MANEPTDSGIAGMDAGMLEKIQNILRQIYATTGDLINRASVATHAAAQLGGTFGDVAEGLLDVGTEAEKAEAKLEKFALETAKAAKKAAAEFESFAEKVLGIDFGSINVSGLFESVNKEFADASSALKQGTDQLNNVLSENRINLAEAITFNLTASISEKVLKGALELEKKFTIPMQELGPLIANSIGGSLEAGAYSAEGFATAAQMAFTGTARAAQETGFSIDKSREALTALSGAGIRAAEVFVGTTDVLNGSSKGIDVLTTTMRISAGTGLDMGKTGAIMQTNIRSLGREMSETGVIFAALSLAQEQTGLRFAEVSESVMAGASTLKYYGTDVESLSGTFNAFIKSVGKGREELGKELFQNAITSIEQMNFGMKAFLGMQSSIGAGRGAIGSGLEFEQKIAEGKTDEIFASLRQQLEQFGGGQILTRQQALDTGQETQYYQQRSLLSTMTNEGDTGKLEMMLGILQRGELERSQELFGPSTLDTRATEIQNVGQKRIDMETGPVQATLNKLRAEESEAMGNMIGAYFKASEKIGSATDHIVSSLKDIAKAALDTLGKKGWKGTEEGGVAEGLRIAREGKAASGQTVEAGKSVEYIASPQAAARLGAATTATVASDAALNAIAAPDSNTVSKARMPVADMGLLRDPSTSSHLELSSPTAPSPAAPARLQQATIPAPTTGAASPTTPPLDGTMQAPPSTAVGPTASASAPKTAGVVTIPLRFTIENGSLFASIDKLITATVNSAVT